MNRHLKFFNYDEAFDYYCNLIDKMKQGNNAKQHSTIIAKPALILAIIELIESGKTVNLFTSEELEPIYKSIFGKHFIEAHQHNLTPLCYPHYYLRTDKFWHYAWTNAEITTHSPSAAWIARNVKHAYIDQELWVLLSYEPYRHKMKQYIIEEKIRKAYYREHEGTSMLKTLLHLLMVV